MNVTGILTISIDELSKREWQALEKKLTYMRGDNEIVTAYRKLVTKGVYHLPRGAWSLLPNSIRYRDRRTFPPMPELNFILKLNDLKRDKRFKGQEEAVAAMFENEQGLVIRPPGTGKTQIALGFAARCKTRTLVIVHTEDILQQWVEYVGNAIPELDGEVGIVRGKRCDIGHITIATVQTLQNYISNKKWWHQFGCVIVDEAHHVAAPSWEAVLNRCTAKFRFGFTASPTRADGMHPSMRFILGPVIHREKFSSAVKLEVVPVITDFNGMYRGSFDWTRLVTQLVQDPERNYKIAKVVKSELEKGNSVLVLSRRIEHLERIQALLGTGESAGEILTGKRTGTDRKDVLERFRSGRVRLLLATQLADEALDVPRLNRILLTHPGKHEGRIIQQIGRAIRAHPTKKDAVIYDFVDQRVGVLRRQWNERKRTYKQLKISVRSTGRIASWKNR